MEVEAEASNGFRTMMTNGRHVQEPVRRSPWAALRPGQSLLLFPAAVTAGWGLVVAALAVAARLFADEQDRPFWGEVAASTVLNAATVFVAALAVSLVVRLVSRRGAAGGGPAVEAGVPSAAGRARAWTVRGHPVLPTSTEGRLALGAALLAVVPFLGGPAMVAAPVLLVLALRRGDRGLLLALPLLAGLILVVLLVAEFTVGHD